MFPNLIDRPLTTRDVQNPRGSSLRNCYSCVVSIELSNPGQSVAQTGVQVQHHLRKLGIQGSAWTAR